MDEVKLLIEKMVTLQNKFLDKHDVKKFAQVTQCKVSLQEILKCGVLSREDSIEVERVKDVIKGME